MEKKNICVIAFICVIIGMITLTLSLWASSKRLPLTSGTCAIYLEYLPPYKQQPLLLRQNKESDYLNAFVLPNDGGLLSFKAGEKINIACPGENNRIVLNGANSTSQFEEARCEEELNFNIIGKSIRIYNITCFSAPKHSARINDSCGGNKEYQEILIGFEVPERFIKHLTVCYDRELQHSLYSHQILSSWISGGQRDSTTFDFIQGEFYDEKLNVDDLYKKITQRKTVNNILGVPDEDTNDFYIKDNRTFLSRGHYTARADFFYVSQQSLTYYFVNVAPQWESFNSGNWKNMEIKCREFAKKKRLDLDIFTGSYGFSKLPNYDNTMLKELYLWKVPKNDSLKGIPVPRLYYRVVYDQKSQAGVVFVGVNNPYTFFSKEDIICKDVCDQINWIGTDQNRTNIELGYFYCCEIADFRKTVTTIPELTVKSLLN